MTHPPVHALVYTADGPPRQTQEVCDDPTRAAQSHFRTLRPPCTTLEDKTRLIQGWMHDCVENHNTCDQGLMHRLPKRVLRLTRKIVYLEERLGKRAAYACLSHCWGPRGPAIKLTKDTAERLRAGIAITDLPKTFADAVEVCLQLRIFYLWIDAMCRFDVELMTLHP